MKLTYTILLLVLVATLSFGQKTELVMPTGYSGSINQMEFTPDGKYLLTNADVIILWDVYTGKQIRKFNKPRKISYFSLSDDSRHFSIYNYGDSLTYTYDISKKEPVRIEDKNGNFLKNEMSDKESKKITYSNNADFKKKLTEKIKHYPQFKNAPRINMWLSHDLKLAACACNSWECGSKYTYFVNTERATIIDSVEINEIFFALHPNKKWFAIEKFSTIELYDRSDKEKIRTFQGMSYKPEEVWFSHDLKKISFKTWRGIGNLKLEGTPAQLKNFVYSTGLRIGKNITVKRRHEKVYSESYKYDYKYIALVDCETGEEIKETKKGYLYKIYDVSPDLQYAIGVMDVDLGIHEPDLKMALIDLDKDEIVKEALFHGSSRVAEIFKFTSDGKYIIAANLDDSFDDDPFLIKAKSLKPDKKLLSAGWVVYVLSANISADGNYLVCGFSSGQLAVYDLNRKKETKQFGSRKDRVSNARLSNDNSKVVACIANEIVLFDFESGNEESRFSIPGKEVADLHISNDNKYITITFQDNSAKVFDTKGNELFELVFFYSHDWLALAPDGRFDGTADGMQKLQYVRGLDVFPVESLFEQFYQPNLISLALSGKLPPMTRISENTNALSGDLATNEINQLLPIPEVEIVSPANKENVNSQTAKIELNIKSKGGVDEIRLYHNNKLAETTQRGFKSTKSEHETITRTFTISLTTGENKIKATVFNSQRSESIPDEITIFYDGKKATSDLYAIIVGLDQYKNSSYNLNYAVADATAFKNEIEKGGGEIFNNINIRFLKDEDATRSNILAKLEEIKSIAKQEDVFVFYYAGHGVMSEEIDSKFHIVPYEVTQLYGNNEILKTNAISAKQLEAFSIELKAQKQLYVFDACQSGGMTDFLAQRGAAKEKAIAQLARSTGTYWLMASDSEQFATEFKELGHGLFTYCILQGLQCQADGGTKDQKITVKELSSFLDDKVPEVSEKYKGEAQYPKLFGFGMDFPIVICR